MYNAIAHHPKPNAQPVPEQRSLTPGQLPPLYTEHDVIWYGISLGLVWVSCPGCVPSQPLVKINSLPAQTRTMCNAAQRLFSVFLKSLTFFLLKKKNLCDSFLLLKDKNL